MLYLNNNRSFEFISLILPRVVIPISPDVPLGMVRCERSIILSLNGDGMDSRVFYFRVHPAFLFFTKYFDDLLNHTRLFWAINYNTIWT